MMKRMKKERGITLIALVITIIVLLILAAVSIATLTGENGILAKATKARTETDKATAKEQVQIAVMASYDQDGKLNLDTLKKELNKIEGKGSIEDTNGDFPVKVTVNGYSFEIDKDGKITDGTGGGSEDKNEIGDGNTTGGGDTPTPPENTPAVPGEKVIGENKEYENNGKAIIPVDFAIVPGLDDVSEGLVISDVANDTENKGNQFVWVPVTAETEYKRNTTFKRTDVSAEVIDDTNYLPEGITNEEQAVREAGGFYIARYETGKEGSATVVSKKGATVWRDISQTDAKAKAKEMFTNNDKVKSALISGVQWDLSMAFISSKPRIDGLGNIYDVTKYSSTRHKESSVEVAGNNEADKVCNIYDLEGNAKEYIAEKDPTFYEDNSYIIRGGSYSTFNEASYRIFYNSDDKIQTSFRIALYVK